MTTVVGHTEGLRSKALRRLERLAKKRIPVDEIISREAARELATLSSEFNRRIGLLIRRSGRVEMVIIGDHERITIPALSQIRSGGSRLRGLRCVQTSLKNQRLSNEEIMDMICLRLDLMSILTLREELPDLLYTAHPLPSRPQDKADSPGYQQLPAEHPAQQSQPCLELIEGIEEEFARSSPLKAINQGQDRALLVAVTTDSGTESRASMAELVELARAAGVVSLGEIIQQRKRIHPNLILGRGKLTEVMLESLRVGADLLVFDQELSPSQIRSVTDHTDLRVIDRTQLILDIFAKRARSREGKLQIEIAQLKYMLPRLSGRDDALSRLTGGIGARGPGETKLEVDRRRINDRIARLARELKQVGQERYRRRNRRRKGEVPVVSLIGYTNAGKSTLLNQLTQSEIYAENLLFATLDPTSRRLRLPEEREVVITDTVGFIRNLPAELLKAFESTLEELHEADLLVHVIDAANPTYQHQIDVVEGLITDLGLCQTPIIKVYNKIDCLTETTLEKKEFNDGIPLSALVPTSLTPLVEKIRTLCKAPTLLTHQIDPTTR